MNKRLLISRQLFQGLRRSHACGRPDMKQSVVNGQNIQLLHEAQPQLDFDSYVMSTTSHQLC